jgi:hypothetical protein
LLRQIRGPADLALFLHVLAFAAAVPALMRLKLPRLGPLLEPRDAPAAPDPDRVQKIVSTVDLVLGAGRPLVRLGCLTRGVTLYYFLRRAGLDVSLCFGMGEMGGDFAGHCWLVKEGEPYLERTDPRPDFAPVYSIP